MSLIKIKEGALELKSLRDEKDSLNDRIKDINEKIRDLEEYRINSLMEDMNITDITLDDIRVRRGVIFRGAITSTSDKEKFGFLYDTDNDGALKKHLIIDLSKLSEGTFSALQQELKARGIEYETNYSIHHMTLSSLIKEIVADGKLSTDDFDRYKIYAQPQIKVEQKK